MRWRVNSFWVRSGVDPASLSVNKKHLLASHLPKDVKQAQDDLITEIKSALITADSGPEWDNGWMDGEDGSIFHVTLEFGFRSDNSDIDGPIKRVLDALEKALVARGYVWNDRMVWDLTVSKYISKDPSIMVKVEKME